MEVDLMARNFEDEHNAKITTKNGLLAPGMSRQMQINLRAGHQPGSTVGIMELDLHNKLHGYHETVVVPVFFYVGDHALLGRAVPKPATAETIRLQYNATRRARMAAGLPTETDVWMPADEVEMPSQIDVESVASVNSSLQMGSITTGQPAVKPISDKSHPSVAQGLSVNFGRHRASWYGRYTVGGGGKAIGAFSKDYIKTAAGSGASVAASLRSSSVSTMVRSGGYERPFTEGADGSLARYNRPSGSSSIFDDGNVFREAPLMSETGK